MNSFRRLFRYSRKLCSMLMLPILIRLSRFCLSSIGYFPRPKTWEEWLRRRERVTLIWLPNSSPREVEVSQTEAVQLQRLNQDPGWGVYCRHLRRLADEVDWWFKQAETPEQWRYRKGFYDSVLRVLALVDVLISQGEEGDNEVWARQQLQEQATELVSLLLGTEKAPTRLRPDREQRADIREATKQH